MPTGTDAQPEHLGWRQSSASLPLLLLLGLLTALLVAPVPALLLAAAVAGAGFIFWALTQVLNGHPDLLVAIWMICYPFGYYFLSFPRKGAWVTLDRAIIFLIVVSILFAVRRAAVLPTEFRWAGIAWASFIGAAALSLFFAAEWVGPLRNLIDSFVLPGLLAWWVLTRFRVTEYVPALHLASCLATLAIFSVGCLELLTLDDVMSFSAGTFFKFGADGGLLLRVNGPFETNNSYALIGLTLFFLLGYLRFVSGKISWMRRLLHVAASVAAVAVALMPLFRSVMLSLLVVFSIEVLVFSKRKHAKLWFISAVIALILAFSVFQGLAPGAAEDRLNADNLYARIAQQFQTLQLFARSPIFGVGFGGFVETAAKLPLATYKDVASVDSAHSNLGSVLAETGIMGFLPYVLSQIFLLRAFWALRRRSAAGRHAFRFLLYVFLGYWINGLALTSGYYGDLNMIWMFTVAVICRHAMMTEAPLASPGIPLAQAPEAGR